MSTPFPPPTPTAALLGGQAEASSPQPQELRWPLHADPQRAELRAALSRLRLAQEHLPERVLGARTYYDVHDERAFTVVSPEQTDKTSAELLRLFKTDQKQDWSVDFEHSVFDANADVSTFQALPLYFHGLSLTEAHFIPSGIVRRPHATDYFLLMANEQGRYTSLMKFTLVLELLDEALGDDFDLDEQEQHTVQLNIHLDALYTRCRFRGRGAGRAMAQALADLVYTEVQHLAAQWAPTYERTGEPLQVVPCVESRWYSKTGLMAHVKCLEAIDELAQCHEELLDDEPQRRAVTFQFSQDHDSDYA